MKLFFIIILLKSSYLNIIDGFLLVYIVVWHRGSVVDILANHFVCYGIHVHTVTCKF